MSWFALTASAAGCGSEPAETRFVLFNVGELPIWYQGGPPSTDGFAWLGVRDEEGGITMTPGCSSVCGSDNVVDCAPSFVGGVGRIEPGRWQDLGWSGYRYEWNAEDRCTEKIAVDDGEVLTARFCWAASYVVEVGPEGEAVGATVVEPECAEQTFSFGSVAEVSHAVEASAPEASVRFVIENGGAEAIVVQSRFDCTTDPGWITVYDLESTLSLRESCWLCPCGSNEGCAESCPDSCAAPAVEQVPPGGLVELTWDGMYYAPKDEGPCEQLEPAPRAPLYAELCWGTVDQVVGTASTGEQIFEPHCERHEIDLRVGGEVRVVAGP